MELCHYMDHRMPTRNTSHSPTQHTPYHANR